MNDRLRHEQFLHLFLPLQPGLHGYLRTLILNRTDAEDVLQAAATVMWEKFDEFQPGTRFDRWAYNIAHLQALRHLTACKRNKLVFNEGVLALLADEAVAINQNAGEITDALESCVAALPERDRELLKKRFGPKGATNRSVATSLGRSEGAISRTLSRLFDNLLECIRQRVDLHAKESRPR